MESFTNWFAKINHLDETYVAGPEERNAHRKSARAFFENSLEFLRLLPLDDTASVLDVGLGYGYHCEWFSSRGLETVGISVHVNGFMKQQAEKHGYIVKKMDMHFLDFPDNSFDLIWSHHSMEHSFSPVYVLREWLRVLRPGGYLAVTVPPHKEQIVSGHFNVGWNVGQLVYLLGITGYNLQDGIYFERGYNVRALVQKPQVEPDYTGLSWIFKLKKQLPRSLRERLVDAPASLGRCYYEGAIEELSPDKYCLKVQSNE